MMIVLPVCRNGWRPKAGGGAVGRVGGREAAVQGVAGNRRPDAGGRASARAVPRIAGTVHSYVRLLTRGAVSLLGRRQGSSAASRSMHVVSGRSRDVPARPAPDREHRGSREQADVVG